MIAAVIRFVLPAGTDWNSMRALARQRANTFYRHVPELRTKAFIISPEQRIYGGLYVWENCIARAEVRQRRHKLGEGSTLPGLAERR